MRPSNEGSLEEARFCAAPFPDTAAPERPEVGRADAREGPLARFPETEREERLDASEALVRELRYDPLFRAVGALENVTRSRGAPGTEADDERGRPEAGPCEEGPRCEALARAADSAERAEGRGPEAET